MISPRSKAQNTSEMPDIEKAAVSKEKQNIPLIAVLLMDRLDEMDEGNGDIQKERLEMIDQLCEHLDHRDVLFRVVLDLLLYGPCFGKYYPLIIPYFRDEQMYRDFVAYSEGIGWDHRKSDMIRFYHAIQAEHSKGLHIVNGVLKSVFFDEDTIVVPDSVHTIGRYSFFHHLPTATKKIMIPVSVRHIEDAFCLRRTEFSILYQGTRQEWANVSAGKNQWGSKEWFEDLQVSCIDDE